jgi:thiosulfate dehydrogenase (quinone) large subunit
MTISRERVRQNNPTHGEVPSFDRDEYAGRVGSVERETVRPDTVRILATEARSVRESEPGTSGVRRLGCAIRVLFGLIWLVDAYFKWQPSFLNGLLDVMHDGAMGQPGWITPWFNFNHAIIAVQPTVWAYGIAIVETGIALALIFGVARKVTYISGAVWSLMIWATAEGFGHMSSGVATDIGTAVIYVMVFLAFLVLDRCDGTRGYSLDAVLERRVPWWARIAEVRG